MSSDVLDDLKANNTNVRLSISTNSDSSMAIKLIYNPLIVDVKTGTMLAAVILMLFYALLVWEVSFYNHFVLILLLKSRITFECVLT